MNDTDTKTKILLATIDILGKHGPGGFSAATLAKEVGVSKATIFHHFPSLDEVPLAALDLFAHQMIQSAMPAAKNLHDLVSSLGELSFTLMKERREFFRAYFVFFNKAMFDDRLRSRLLESLEYFKGELLKLFLKCGLKHERASELSYLAMICLDGACLHWQVSNDPEDIKRAWACFGRLVEGD